MFFMFVVAEEARHRNAVECKKQINDQCVDEVHSERCCRRATPSQRPRQPTKWQPISLWTTRSHPCRAHSPACRCAGPGPRTCRRWRALLADAWRALTSRSQRCRPRWSARRAMLAQTPIHVTMSIWCIRGRGGERVSRRERELLLQWPTTVCLAFWQPIHRRRTPSTSTHTQTHRQHHTHQCYMHNKAPTSPQPAPSTVRVSDAAICDNTHKASCTERSAYIIVNIIVSVIIIHNQFQLSRFTSSNNCLDAPRKIYVKKKKNIM